MLIIIFLQLYFSIVLIVIASRAEWKKNRAQKRPNFDYINFSLDDVCLTLNNKWQQMT